MFYCRVFPPSTHTHTRTQRRRGNLSRSTCSVSDMRRGVETSYLPADEKLHQVCLNKDVEEAKRWTDDLHVF